jgi:hypothetical protein
VRNSKCISSSRPPLFSPSSLLVPPLFSLCLFHLASEFWFELADRVYEMRAPTAEEATAWTQILQAFEGCGANARRAVPIPAPFLKAMRGCLDYLVAYGMRAFGLSVSRFLWPAMANSQADPRFVCLFQVRPSRASFAWAARSATRTSCFVTSSSRVHSVLCAPWELHTIIDAVFIAHSVIVSPPLCLLSLWRVSPWPGPASLAKGPARGQDAATVAGAFKQLLRLAPECVFTNGAYAEFVRAATDAGKLRALIAALPAANQVCAGPDIFWKFVSRFAQHFRQIFVRPSSFFRIYCAAWRSN